MPYSNALVLEILRQEETLKMSLFEQREFASTLRHYSQAQVSFSEIRRLCQEITFIINKVGRKDAFDTDLFNRLKKAAQLLWDYLLTKQVKERLKSAKILNLVLSIEEELIDIPWELLYNGKNFLCLEFNLGRVVKTKGEADSLQYRSSSGIPKMLILANPTADLKGSYEEGLNIKNQFDRKRSDIRIDFKSTHIDKIYVKKNLCDYDIVHFAGHFEHIPDNPKNSGWALSDGRFGAGDVLSLGVSATLPALVFSNGCFSGLLNSDTDEADYQEKNYNLASAFLFSGVRHYIGAIRRIEDPVSLSFAKEFYSQLIAGKSVGESIRLARLELINEHGISAIYWAGYLLYGDPNFILFRARITTPARPRLKELISAHKKRIINFCLSAAMLAACLFLYVFLRSVSPDTYILFLKSQKLFKSGNNQGVILAAGSIINKNPSFAPAYPVLADAYYRIGRRQDALRLYFDYALLCEKAGSKEKLTSAYLKIGWFYHLDGEYDKAFDFYNKALLLAQQNKDKLNEALSLRRLAVWHIDKKGYSQALELLTKSSEINRQKQHLYEYRYNLACDYFDIGLVFANKNDFKAAREFYDKSRVLFEKLNLKNELSDYYFNLGEICLFEKEYQGALAYYMRGLKIDQEQDNKMNLTSDYNMIGELYVEMGRFEEAEHSFNESVSISKELNARPELAASFHNLGLLYKKMRKTNKAKENLRLAQEIYLQIDTDSYEEVKKELLGLGR